MTAIKKKSMWHVMHTRCIFDKRIFYVGGIKKVLKGAVTEFTKIKKWNKE